MSERLTPARTFSRRGHGAQRTRGRKYNRLESGPITARKLVSPETRKLVNPGGGGNRITPYLAI
jgi:hypothetical protein